MKYGITERLSRNRLTLISEIFICVGVAAIAFTIGRVPITPTVLSAGNPTIDVLGDWYYMPVTYNNGHGFIACFTEPEEINEFLKLGYVVKAGNR